MLNDTICAIATAPSNSGISIIRVSGQNALDIVDLLFVNPSHKHILKSIESHTISYGFLLDGNEVVDEVLVSFFKGPKSFTAEDTVEINCHGGIFVTNRILDLVISKGARLAQPGEFTKRAFLNGRIDLTKAEAVMDLISSTSNLSLQTSISQLRGSIYNQIKSIRSDIIFEIAFIESALDDPEHYTLDEEYHQKLHAKLSSIIEITKNLINSSENGRIIKGGIRTVILGKPNAGKSSILNLLAQTDRAIVTDIAGTTRDVIEEQIKLGSISLSVFDTAGIRNTDDKVESIGVDRALNIAQEADLILFVVDSSVNLDENDYRIIDYIKDKKVIVLINKSDLNSVISKEEIEKYFDNVAFVSTSAVLQTGISQLEDVIKNMFSLNEIDSSNEVVITSLRHKEALVNALNSLNQVMNSLNNNMSEDFYSVDLMDAYSYYGSIIGEEISDDLVNEIFEKFCMGK